MTRKRSRWLWKNICFNMVLATVMSLAAQASGATYYVWSGATGAADGSSFTDAYTALATALTGKSAGDVFLLSHAHSEVQTTFNLNSPGTSTNPCSILCVDQNTLSLTTGAVITQSGATAISFTGHAYIYGLQILQGVPASTATLMQFASTSSAGWGFTFERSVLGSLSTSASAVQPGIMVGSSSKGVGTLTRLEMIDSSFQFGTTTKSVNVRNAEFIWRGSNVPAITGTVLATNPLRIYPPNQASVEVLIDGVDFSAMTGTTYSLITISTGTNSVVPGSLIVRNSKLGAGVITATGTTAALEPAPGRFPIEFINCDSGDTNYKFHGTYGLGTVEAETTVTLTGGASDGATSYSRKMVSQTGASLLAPLASPPVVFWNETTTTQTLDVEIVNDGATLTDAEVWLEVDYLSGSSAPASARVSDRMATVLSTSAAQTTSTASWTTTGLASPVKQRLSVAFTPVEKGLVSARVMIGKPNTTIYYDPKFLVGSGRQYRGLDSLINEGAAGGSSIGRPRIGGGLR